MEKQEITSFNNLFQEITIENFLKIFPTVQKCIAISKNEEEVIRALEISLKFGVQLLTIDKLEHEIFRHSCIAAKNIFLQRINLLENEISDLCEPLNDRTEAYLQILKSCIEIISYFCAVFKYLNKYQEVKILHVKSLFLNLLEILQISFNHCNVSEKIYDSSIHSFSEYLTSLFKKCCKLLEEVLDFFIEKINCTLNAGEEEEIKLFSQFFTLLSKCSFSLMSLDVKIMAKIWKTLIFFLEKYFMYLKNELDVGKLINFLCEIILSKTNYVTGEIQESEETNRVIKLSCFNLKLIIKICNICEGYIKDCQKSLLSLILMLCRTSIFYTENDNIEKFSQQNLLHQLLIGIDPLLSYLINDNKLIEECSLFTTHLWERKNGTFEFSIFCCLILKKIFSSNYGTRKLWFNESANILQWLFECISEGKNDFIMSKHLPKVFIPKKQERKVDLYEFMLETASAFIMTTTSSEFILVEKTLIENIFQENPFSALFAIDIWCLLARFADSKLCEIQVCKLYKIFQQFHENTLRVEKWYLLILIGRLLNLMTNKQKEIILKSFESSILVNRWKHKILYEEVKLNLFSLNDCNNLFLMQLENWFHEDDAHFSNNNMDKSLLGGGKSISESSLDQSIKMWKFNCNTLSCNSQEEKFLRIASLLTTYNIPQISSEHLALILSKVKELLSFKQSTSILLYFTWILKSLTIKKLPLDDIQRSIIETTADIFNLLLSFENCFVKLKALEIFFCFSHFTAHTEIIALTVRNSPFLKIEITTYFQRKFSDKIQIDFKKYLSFLFSSKFCHICLKSTQFKQIESVEILKTEKFNYSVISRTSIEELINRLKDDQQKIIKNINRLSNLHKKEIENICTLIISSIAKETMNEYK